MIMERFGHKDDEQLDSYICMLLKQWKKRLLKSSVNWWKTS